MWLRNATKAWEVGSALYISLSRVVVVPRLVTWAPSCAGLPAGYPANRLLRRRGPYFSHEATTLFRCSQLRKAQPGDKQSPGERLASGCLAAWLPG